MANVARLNFVFEEVLSANVLSRVDLVSALKHNSMSLVMESKPIFQISIASSPYISNVKPEKTSIDSDAL